MFFFTYSFIDLSLSTWVWRWIHHSKCCSQQWLDAIQHHKHHEWVDLSLRTMLLEKWRQRYCSNQVIDSPVSKIEDCGVQTLFFAARTRMLATVASTSRWFLRTSSFWFITKLTLIQNVRHQLRLWNVPTRYR